MNYQFVGYAPDSDPTLPGVFPECSAIVPTLKGYKGAPSPVSSGLSLASRCQGAAVVTKLDETNRFLAGTGTALYEASSGSFSDVTRASGAYTAGSDVRWRFAQFGNVTLAAIKSDILQSSTSGAFANVGASIPKFGIVETVGQFVFGFDAADQGTLIAGADEGDRWWCCAKGDHTNWTPSTTTESASGRLTSSPGKIRAGKRFGANIVAYKERSMHLGVYVGPPFIWDFDREIPGRVGALSQEVVVDVGTAENPRHIFMGYEDFYSFDGVRPVPIGTNRVKVKVFSEINRARAYNCMALHDRTNSLIYFYYPVADSVNPDKCVVYNYRTDKWGRDDRSVEAVVEYVESGMTYEDLGDDYSTYGDLPTDVTYGAIFWAASYPTPAIINTSHAVQTLNGASSTSSITTGDIGDDVYETLVSRVKPRYLTAPSSASMVNYYRQNIGDSLTTDATTSQANSRFDLLREARWHRFRFDFTGDVELPGCVIDITKQGDE